MVMRLRETPVPIPNTTVKPEAADDTALETVWKSRWLPDFLKNNFIRQSAQESEFDAKGRLEPGIRYKVGFGSAGEVKIKQAPK